MNAIGQAQNLVLLVLGIGAVALEAFALIDAFQHRQDAYLAAGKRTKRFWLVILGVALALGFVTFANVLSLLPLVAVVAAGIYLADVRPALRQVSGRGTQQGPYGPY